MENPDVTNFNATHRQPKLFFGPLLGFFLANLLSKSAFASLAPLGSIRLEYDPLPFLNLARPTQQPATQKPELVEIVQPSLHHHTERPELVEYVEPHQSLTTSNEYLIHDSAGHNYYFESPPKGPLTYKRPENSKEGIRDLTGESSNYDFSQMDSPQVENQNNNSEPKTQVKRQVYRYPYNRYRNNKYYAQQRRRYGSPVDYFDDDSFEDVTRRHYSNANRRRYQNGRRPVNFDYEYDDYSSDFDYDVRPFRKPLRKNRNKLANRNQQNDFNEDSEFEDDAESVTSNVKPRQRQTTTTMAPETTETTNITTGVTPSNNKTNTTGYGYGPSNGNENISITYAPPLAPKPAYGLPSTGYGAPGYNPNSIYGFSSSGFGGLGYPSVSYDSPSITYGSFTPIKSGASYATLGGTYGTPSSSYGVPGSKPDSTYGVPNLSDGIPSISYGTPSNSYDTPSNTYGTPSNTYGTPSNTYVMPSNTYGTPSNSYGAPPSTSYGIPGRSYGAPNSYQSSSYQLPYSSWYKKGSSRIELARRAQDLLSSDGLYKESFKK